MGLFSSSTRKFDERVVIEISLSNRKCFYEESFWLSTWKIDRCRSIEIKRDTRKECMKSISKVLLIKLQYALFMYKYKIWMLLQIIHAVLMKECTEAALIAISIVFLFIKIMPFFNDISSWFNEEAWSNSRILSDSICPHRNRSRIRRVSFSRKP